MNIIETAKAILHGDADIDPMVIVRAVARLKPVAYRWEPSEKWGYVLSDNKSVAGMAKSHRFNVENLYTLEADK